MAVLFENKEMMEGKKAVSVLDTSHVSSNSTNCPQHTEKSYFSASKEAEIIPTQLRWLYFAESPFNILE